MNDQKSNSPKQDIGEFVAQSKQNAKTLESLSEQIQEGLKELGRRIDRISERSGPNLALLAMWSAILLTIIAMVSAPIGFFFWNAILSLDTKLQKEYSLSIETTMQGLKNLNEISKERHDVAMKGIDRVQEWQNAQIRSDMDELRQRRMRDGSSPVDH